MATSPVAPPTSQRRLVTIYSLVVGLAPLCLLGSILALSRVRLSFPDILVFAGLSLLVHASTNSFPSSLGLGWLGENRAAQRMELRQPPVAHGLSGVIGISAVLALGPLSGATAAALGRLASLAVDAFRRARGRQVSSHFLVTALLDAGLKALCALLGGWLFVLITGYQNAWQGQPWPTAELSAQSIAAVLALCLAWFLLDQLGWGLRAFFERESAGLPSPITRAPPGKPAVEPFRAFGREVWSQAILVELAPLPLGLVLALAYAWLSWFAFALLAAAIIALAWLFRRWVGDRMEMTQRVAELTILEQVGRSMAEAHLDVDELCHLLYEQASRIVDTTIFNLGLFEGDDYVIKLWIRQGQPEQLRAFRLSPGVGLVNWMRESHQPLLIRDFEKEMDSLPARPAYVADQPPSSALFVPLMSGDLVVGSLSVQSYRREAYGQGDLRVLSAMANQAAVAIQKAQLYDQERKRARQLETIGQVSRSVAATLDLEERFEQAVRLIRENFGYYYVAILTADPKLQTITFEASSSAAGREIGLDLAWGEGLIGWVAAQAQAALVNDVQHDARYRSLAALPETRSELSVPLLLEGRLVGVLDVQCDQLNAFGADDQFIVEALGGQVAIAIQEARLYEAEQQQAWLSTALLQVADALRHLSDMNEVLTTIVRLTAMLAGVDRCFVLLLDEDGETFVPTQSYGLTPEARERFGQMTFPAESVPALDLVRVEQSPLQVQADHDESSIPRELIDALDLGDVILLPLLAQDELLGTMLADYKAGTHPFGERIMPMLTGIANQAAMVIQGARLLEAQQEEAYVSSALLQVADAVSRAASLAEALSAVTRITPLLVGVEACAIFLWDAAAGAFVPFQQYGLPKETLAAFWELRFLPQEPWVSELASGATYIALEDLADVAGTTHMRALGRGSLLLLPVSLKGDLVGLMSVDCSGPLRHLTQHRMGILGGIAAQAAIAVENDRLLQESAEQERMKQELNVARRIQASFLPDCCPLVPGWELAIIWRSALEVAGDFYDFIPIRPDSAQEPDQPDLTGVVIADVADKGVPAALFMALSRTLLRTMAISRRSPAAAVWQANNLILADSRAELFVTAFYAVLPHNSGTIAYVNAGHLPPILARAAGDQTQELRTGNMAMGVLADVEYNEHSLHMHRGDALVLYTDGVVEAADSDGQMFGRARLRQVVGDNRALPAADLAQAVSTAVATFVGDAPQIDDLTLIVIKREA